MKEVPLSKLCFIRKINTTKSVLLIASTLILVTIILYHHHHHHHHLPLFPLSSDGNSSRCNIFLGEWIWNPDATYYTNTTCDLIRNQQNCMKYGRPDTDSLKWRWKPNDCELRILDPFEFLKLVRGKSMAFVGDSVGRNQMQSLLCLLSKVEKPVNVSYTTDKQRYKRWRYPSYNFTVANFWTPFLVRAEQAEADAPIATALFNLYLDEYDVKWTNHIDEFDYIIISAGHWFYHPTMFYENGKLVGCLYCSSVNSTLQVSYGYGKAFQTAFKAINSSPKFKGTTYLRTISPSHFENGLWNKGANCPRKKPFNSSSEIKLDDGASSLYKAQVDEFKVAEEEGKKNGKRFRLLDTTHAALLRPDGHPNSYAHWPEEKNVTFYYDCVHWCLPGPIDSWNDLLLEMLRMDHN
ncbi:hypothetical protein MKW94_004598 [Papaver nudicaule]|uniref:Trichome birefringence-like N-terminal domain-containing protein n=1 Tax=Papaver nudicaule TaxID=74823 RepID=A0AA41W391_PAPNU|nr:hypothetical protein [Papaver nudicaule]